VVRRPAWRRRTGIDWRTGTLAAPERLAGDLLAHVRPALRATGDLDEVEWRCCAFGARGGGAARQRALRAVSATPAEFVGRLAAVTRGEEQEQDRKAVQ
jgi:carboxylate-amine ligase